METKYLTSAQKSKQLPNCTLPEVAFLGRSNCGKSALINALCNHKNLARSSSTPGRTQMANFFQFGHGLIFVDLPGYGFNVAKHDIKKLWDDLLETYLDRACIKEFLFLMDIRRNIEDFELDFIHELSEKTHTSLVLTKSDKLNQNQMRAAIKSWTELLQKQQIKITSVVAISSIKKTGIEELRKKSFRTLYLI